MMTTISLRFSVLFAMVCLMKTHGVEYQMGDNGFQNLRDSHSSLPTGGALQGDARLFHVSRIGDAVSDTNSRPVHDTPAANSTLTRDTTSNETVCSIQESIPPERKRRGNGNDEGEALVFDRSTQQSLEREMALISSVAEAIEELYVSFDRQQNELHQLVSDIQKRGEIESRKQAAEISELKRMARALLARERAI